MTGRPQDNWIVLRAAAVGIAPTSLAAQGRMDGERRTVVPVPSGIQSIPLGFAAQRRISEQRTLSARGRHEAGDFLAR
jgi:hypothetical protein